MKTFQSSQTSHFQNRKFAKFIFLDIQMALEVNEPIEETNKLPTEEIKQVGSIDTTDTDKAIQTFKERFEAVSKK